MALLLQAQLESALERALALAQCLDALNASRQVHGGLCPQALDFAGDGGLRLAPAPPAQALTLERLRFASPEQAGRMPQVDTRSDLYSLGLVLYK